MTRLVSPIPLSGLTTSHTNSKEEVFYLIPTGLVSRAIANATLCMEQFRLLVGGPLAFTACEVLIRQNEIVTPAVLTLDTLYNWSKDIQISEQTSICLDFLSTVRPPFAGLTLDQPRLMGVVNVTPDSFSDSGSFLNPYLAIFHGLCLKEAGADIIDVGGESTRPGAQPITAEEEIVRIIPVIKALAERGILVSVDTCKAQVMAAALEAGASIVNDTTALSGDIGSLPLIVKHKVPVILMHMQGKPSTMQDHPNYFLSFLDIYDALASRATACIQAGVKRSDICLDPGIGFGKILIHNLEIMKKLSILHTLGCGLVLGISRKSFIAQLSTNEAPKARLPGSLITTIIGLDQGVNIVRVHDVAEALQAVRIWKALRTSSCSI